MISIASRRVLAGCTWAAGRARGRSARVAPSRDLVAVDPAQEHAVLDHARPSWPGARPSPRGASSAEARHARPPARARSRRSATWARPRRLLLRSWPTNCSTNARGGRGRGSRRAGRTARAMPPTLSSATRSPSLIASSMSWVTITIVLCTVACRLQQLVLEAGAHDRVDRAEGLVHQQHRRVGGQRPGHADALLLAARELVGVAPEHRGVEPDQLHQLVDARPRCAPCPSRATWAPWRCCAAMVRWGNSPTCWMT